MGHSVLVVPLLFLATVRVDSCRRHNFTRISDIHASGRVLPYPALSTLLEPSQCERVCRQMPQCRGINVQMSSDSLGQCQFMTNITGIEENNRSNFHVRTWCPGGMRFSLSIGDCFSVGRTPRTRSEALDHCTTLHHTAHLVEILSDEIMEEVANLTGGIGVWWVGARRERGGDRYDISWDTSEEPVAAPPDPSSGGVTGGNSSINWRPGEPSPMSDNKPCVVLSYGEMASETCDTQLPFICEFHWN